MVARGVEMQPPRYYDKLLPKVIRGMIAENRESANVDNAVDHTDGRNGVREVVVNARLRQLKRS